MDLRPYQQKCKEAIINGLSNGIRSQLVVSPTGTGKTFMIQNTIRGMGRILWIAHTEELMVQAAETWTGSPVDLKNPPTTIGVIKADQFYIDADFVVASAQTLYRRLDRIPADYFDIVIADEADLYLAETLRQPLEYFTPSLLLGATATPYRMDNMPLSDLFHHTVFEYTLLEAVREGYLCKPDAIKIKTSVALDGVKTLGGEFKQNELAETVNNPARNNLIVSKYKEYCTGRQFIAFCVDVQHTIDLCEAFNEQGILTNYVVGDRELSPDRKEVIAAYKRGEYVGLTNAMVLSVGFDHPEIGVAIMACPTKSKRKFIQQLGRGLRLKSDLFVSKFGQNCIILDVVDVTSRHKLINTDELDRGVPLEDKLFIKESDRQKILEVRQRRLNGELTTEDQRIELLPLPVIRLTSTERMREDAPVGHLLAIKALGYDIDNVRYTRQMCTDILLSQPAPIGHLLELKSKGYDVSNGVTVAEYNAALKEIKEREARENTVRLRRQGKPR